MAEQSFVTVAGIRDAMGKRLYDLLGVDDGALIDDNAVLIDAIAATNDLIKDHLRKRYALPLLEIPRSLTDAGYAVCGYKIIQRSRPDIASDRERDTYDDAMAYLDKIAKGTIELQSPPENQFDLLGTAQAVSIGSSQTADSGGTPTRSWFANW